MKTILFILFFFTTVFAQNSNCLLYEPSVVKLTGTIERDTFPGRPNYESIKDGDEPEVYWILRLHKSICVNGKEGDEIDESEADITELQLVFLNPVEKYKQYKKYIGRKVVVTGTLFHSISAHHKTSVLVTVNKITAG